MKKQIKFLGLALLFFIVPFLAHAQYSLLKKANEYYEFLAYNEAIPKYEEILKKDSLNAEVLIKLADCYRLTNDNNKALETYAKVILLKEAKPIHSFLYAQALMIAGKYDEAKIYMNSYKLDERGNIFSKSIDNMKMFYKHADSYQTKKTCFNSSKNDFSPALWQNNSIVYTSSRDRATLVSYKNAWTGNYYDALYIVKKDQKGNFSKSHLFNEEIQTRYNDGTACFSKDGTHIYFTRNNIIGNEDIRSADGKVKLKIFQATLDKNNKFWDVKEFFFNNTEYSCAHPAINNEENILYFSSDMPGGYGGMDIWVSFKKDTTWGKPINLGNKINTSGNEVFPYLFENKKLYFSSNGLDGMGGLDIFTVKINESGMPNGVVNNLGAPLNSPSDDFGIVFNSNGKTGYYSSNFGNVNYDDDIFEFTIVTPLNDIKIQGTVTDKLTKQAIPDSKVILKDLSGATVEEVISDENGKFSFITEFGKDYTLTNQKEEYTDATPKEVSTKINEETAEITIDLTLEKKPFTRLVISVTDSKDNKPLENAKIEIFNNRTNKNDIFNTTPNGNYILTLSDGKVGDSLNYKFALSKDGYITKVLNWQYYIDQIKDININESLNLAQIGTSLDNIITLNPIYFGLNKFNIRPDAALELDKVVAFLKQNPKISIELGSHTDCRGSAKSNQILSEKRAKASVNYIVSKGINKKRLKAKGCG